MRTAGPGSTQSLALQFFAQGLAVDTQNFRGLCLVAADAGQHMADMLGFHLGQGFVAITVPAERKTHGLREIRDVDALPFANKAYRDRPP